MTKTHWKKAFNKDYLGAHDLEEGQELKLTIDHIEVKEVATPAGAKEQRNVAVFKQKVKPMILNATACKQLARFSGSYYIENWNGVNVQVYVDHIKAFGEYTDALRIRDIQPTIGLPELTPNHKNWTNAVAAVKDPKKGMKVVLDRYIVSPENQEALKNAANIS